MLPKWSKVSLATRPETQITSTPGGRQSFAGYKVLIFDGSMGSDRVLGQSTQPWDSIYRESKKLTEFNRMAVNRLKDHIGGKKHSAKVR